MKVKDLIKLIEVDGWIQVRMKGSHRKFKHPTKVGIVTVSGKPSVDVPVGTLKNALKQAGLHKREQRMRFTVILEEGESSYGAYVPDLPGCIAAGETREEALTLIRGAIEFHIEGLKQEGQPLPKPHSVSEVVEVDTA